MEVSVTEEHELDDVDNVLVLKTGNYMLAQFLIGALDEEEIPYLAKGLGGEDRIGAGAITHRGFNPPGLAEIYVSPEDFDRAKELLDSLEGEDFEDFDEDDEDDDESEEEDILFEDDDDR
jgi:hypothetical protein